METLQHVAAAPLERREMSRGFIHRDNRRRYRNTNGSFADAFSYSEQNLASFPDALQYTFYCQLAHGSPTGIISGFRTVKELYRKIAECFDLNPDDIMYCTLNTHRLDVDKMLYREIGINDFLFAHIRSQPKEITIRKECASFGMTLTDTGCGVVFIKRLLPNGMMARIAKSCEGSIEIGDQIERVNNVSFLGRRHYEVANYLRAIPIGETFVLRVVSPERSPIYMLNSRTGWKGSNTSIVSGRRTIRFQGDGLVEERTVPLTEATALRRLKPCSRLLLGL
ncbi:unnamed protein product [Calicophoron daubneyi]|uniref:PDZ domain-containing protein n=1 Tax=Calicophoron daubneyi TaxID=300641 RepID=A0AAV2TGP6_CALDB